MSQGSAKGIPIDVDGTFALNSDLLVPSQKATKTYVDTGLSAKASIVYVDGKVADAIVDGVTTVAPSQNVVFDALTSKQTNFYKDVATSTAVTGVTANTILVSALIPANTFTVGSLAEVRCNIQRVGANGTATYRMYTNTSNSLSGATQLGTYNNTATQLFTPFKRLFGFKTGNVIFGAGSASTLASDETVSTVAPSSNTFDPTVANYFIIAVQPANASDSFTSEIFVIKGNK